MVDRLGNNIHVRAMMTESGSAVQTVGAAHAMAACRNRIDHFKVLVAGQPDPTEVRRME